MNITEIEDRIHCCDRDMDYHKSEVKNIQSEKTELLNLLSIERGKVINVKKDDIFEFSLGIIKLVINKEFFIRSSNEPIKIKISRNNKIYVWCQVIDGTLNRWNSTDSFAESYVFCITKKKLYTLLNDHSSYGEVINRHKTIEEVLN